MYVSQVRVLIGEPIPVDDLLAAADAQQWPDAQLYRAITARISVSMNALKVWEERQTGRRRCDCVPSKTQKAPCCPPLHLSLVLI